MGELRRGPNGERNTGERKYNLKADPRGDDNEQNNWDNFNIPPGKDYVLMETTGKGHYVGTVLAVRTRSPAWFGEGDEQIYIDGETKPSIWGTGTEDYFLSAWGLRRTSTPYFGVAFKGLAVDLVIWNEEHAGYRQGLHEQIMGLIAAGIEANVTDRPGGIFLRPAEQISNEDRVLLQTVARAIISDSRGSLADQINRRGPVEVPFPRLTPTRNRRAEPPAAAALPRRDLIFFNGLGGFTPDGREYVITTAPGQVTPAPWVNVLANPNFGTVVSESGFAYTWSENAHEFRLTPWNNDPVSDASGEAIYIRDEETGHFWSPTPLPSPGATPYASRHGFGYSVFEHKERGIRSELWVYVARDAPINDSNLLVPDRSRIAPGIQAPASSGSARGRPTPRRVPEGRGPCDSRAFQWLWRSPALRYPWRALAFME